MATGRLLDSSILVALFRDDPTMRDRVARETDLFIAATTIGELRYGAMLSMKPSKNEDASDELPSSGPLGCLRHN